MSKALETIKKHIKDLERMEDVFSFYGCFSSAAECKKAIKELTEAIAELKEQDSKVCDGCIRFDHKSHLLNDEQYKLRFQICHRCVRQKTDLFEPIKATK